MIYIKNDTTTVRIPKYVDVEGGLTLKLTNIMTTHEYFTPVTDESSNPIFYEFKFSGSSLPLGEYTYEVLRADKILSGGILVCGEYTSSNIQYEAANEAIYYEK